MDFLSTFHADVRLLLMAGALALLAALVSGSKKNEYRYFAICTVLLLVAGVRHYQEENQDLRQPPRGSAAAPSP